jgi:hypothetical protein
VSVPVADRRAPGEDGPPPDQPGSAPSAGLRSDDTSDFSGQGYFWFGLSLAFSVFCGIEGLRHAFFADYIVQDDARTFVFWMERFLHPELFPNDLIAAYFAAVSPPGYTAIHQVAAVVFGIDPFTVNKVLPIVLGVIMTVYAYFACLQLLRVPVAAFAAATILNESVWQADAIPSGTPRAFIYPIVLAFIYYSLRRQRVAVLCTVGLLGLFYPQLTTILLGALCLRLLRWDGRRLHLSSDKGDYAVCISAIVLAVSIVAIALQQSSSFGPVVTANEARSMIEFSLAGRTNFFSTDWTRFWIFGERSGIIPYGIHPPLIWLGALLPVFALMASRFTVLKRLSPSASLLARVVVASLGMFGLAHLLLFRLHLPSRYTQHSLRIVLALAAGIVLFVILKWLAEFLRGGAQSPAHRWMPPRVLVGASMIFCMLSYPVAWLAMGGEFPTTQYLIGRDADLYAFLREQPENIMIASLSQEADLIPSFAQRSILTGYEYGIPYHQSYYTVVRQRMHDLVRAQYSTDPAEVRSFIQRYGVSHWLLNRQAFTPFYVSTNRWIRQATPESIVALKTIDDGQIPALMPVAEQCGVFRNARFVLADATCVAAALGG